MSVSVRTWVTSQGEVRTKWVVRYYDRNRKYRTKTFNRKRDADLWSAHTKIDLKKGVHRPDSTSVTLGFACEWWVDRARNEKLERSTIAKYALFCRVHIKPLTADPDKPNGWTGKLETVKLSQLTTPMCMAIRRELLKRNSRAMARQIFAAFKAVLKEAQVEGLIAYNPAQPVSITQNTRDQIPILVGEQIPSKEDIRAILLASTADTFPCKGYMTLFSRARWYPLFITAAFTGMRASELRGLTWAHVDLDRKVIRVRQRADCYREIGLCKTKSAYREIQIPDEVAAALRAWRAICPDTDLDLVFPNSRGRVEFHANIVLYGWYRVQKHLGMCTMKGAKYAAKYGFHSLRHFYASLMIDEGIEPKRLQALLGHATLGETMDTYGHLFPDGGTVRTRVNNAAASVLAPAQDAENGGAAVSHRVQD